MQISHIKKILNRIILQITSNRNRKHLRQAMRGYRYLRLINRVDLILEIKNEITDTQIKKINLSASSLVFGIAKSKAELIVRQYLLSRLVGRNLNIELLRIIGDKNLKFCYPLPTEWLRIIEKNNLKVNYLRSQFMFKFFVFFRYLISFIVIAKIIFQTFNKSDNLNIKRGKNYVFFINLTYANLPLATSGKSYDIISWYDQWPGKINKLYGIFHDVKNIPVKCINKIYVVSMPGILPPLIKSSTLIIFFAWCFKAVSKGLFDFLRNRWWNTLMLSEGAIATKAKLSDSEYLAKEYYFHNSGIIYRPLWTYEVERLGSKILFYFYSTNLENFKYADRYPIQSNSWQVVNWPVYLVWDAYHADFVKRVAGDKVKIIESGPIWFHAGINQKVPNLTQTISVFDVQPHRDSIYQTLGIDLEYYTPDVANKFILDIYRSISKNEGVMLFKRKRDIGNKIHPKYKFILREIKMKKNFHEIDSEVSAFNLIESSFAVISMPFTSTGKIAKALGKPSIYYDPLGIIQKDDRAAHGIPVLIGYEELDSWVKIQLGRFKIKQHF